MPWSGLAHTQSRGRAAWAGSFRTGRELSESLGQKCPGQWAQQVWSQSSGQKAKGIGTRSLGEGWALRDKNRDNGRRMDFISDLLFQFSELHFSLCNIDKTKPTFILAFRWGRRRVISSLEILWSQCQKQGKGAHSSSSCISKLGIHYYNEEIIFFSITFPFLSCIFFSLELDTDNWWQRLWFASWLTLTIFAKLSNLVFRNCACIIFQSYSFRKTFESNR